MTQNARDIVLLLTHSEDLYTVDRVAEALRERGVRPIRVNTDLFPTQLQLSARTGRTGSVHRLRFGETEVTGTQVRAVWNRKFRLPQLDENLDPQFRDACRRESHAAFEAFLDGLAGARWINPLDCNRSALNKARQLREASAAGLPVPETLLTNDPDEVRRFFDEQGGDVVTKMLTPLSSAMGKAQRFVRTSPVRREDLARLASLRHCPMVFQRRVEKDREFRVIVVAGRVFVGGIDASDSAAGKTDWRSATPEECAWHEDALPQQVVERIQNLMARLDLLFGAIDLIRTPEGTHVFLEVNPAGEWGMLERDLGCPISDTIAEALLTRDGGSIHERPDHHQKR